MIWLLSVLLALNTAVAKEKKKSGKRKKASTRVYLTKVSSCNPQPLKDGQAAPTGKINLIKQWDLSARTSTKGFKEKYAQEKNQTAIYKSLDQDVKDGKIQLIVAEGCEGEMGPEFASTFNGWDYESLKSQSRLKNYERIITSVPLKIKAKHGEKIKVVCGDNLMSIQEGNLRLSNLRGWTGYWSKFEELKNDPAKLKPFAEAAAAVLKVPASTPSKDLADKIRAELKKEIEGLNTSISQRDEAFVKALSENQYATAAVVVGGLHMADLKTKLEQAGMACDIFEPPGYTREEEDLIQNFQNILTKK